MYMMFQRLTDRARRAMVLANSEAQQLGHTYIGDEHVLLGLIAERHGVAAHVLANLGLTLDKARQEIGKLVHPGPVERSKRLPRTFVAQKVIENSTTIARQMNHQYVGTEHLLLGLIVEPRGVAGWALLNCGLFLEKIRNEVADALAVDRAAATIP